MKGVKGGHGRESMIEGVERFFAKLCLNVRDRTFVSLLNHKLKR